MRSRWGTSRRPFVATAAVGALLAGSLVAVSTPGDQASAATGQTAPSSFVPVEPCRRVDTRLPGAPARLVAGGSLEIGIVGHCGVPEAAVAVAVTVTAVDAAAPGYLTPYPAGVTRPTASLVNYGAGDVVANHQFVGLGADGALTVFSLAGADVLVDVMGYFVPAVDGESRSGRFVPVTQRRLLDTRLSGRPAAGASILIEPGVEADVVAVVVNVTTTATREAGFFTAFPAGHPPPVSSILNVSGVGQTRAASVVVPVSNEGIEVFTSAANHVIVDIVGYFTGPEAPSSSDGLFVAVTPQRLVDTRLTIGESGGPRLWDDGAREFAVDGVTGGAVAAVAVNATVTETEDIGFVAAYPVRTPVPPTSAVNYDRAQHTVANFAVVNVSSHGFAAQATEATHLVVDVSGWFTGQPVSADGFAPRNEPPPERRVTVVGDSAMAGIRWNGALGGFQGFDAVAHLESCRRLVQSSCRGREGYAPPTATAHIESLPQAGPEEILVIAVGYNDWHERFSSDFEVVVDAARRKGFRHIVWVDYRSNVSYQLPGGGGVSSNYAEMNRILGVQLGSGRFPEVRRWSLEAYTAESVGWFHGDGVHETQLGSWGVADWISRHVRAYDGRACVQPWVAGQPVENPCPNPDDLAGRRGVPDISALYAIALG